MAATTTVAPLTTATSISCTKYNSSFSIPTTDASVQQHMQPPPHHNTYSNGYAVHKGHHIIISNQHSMKQLVTKDHTPTINHHVFQIQSATHLPNNVVVEIKYILTFESADQSKSSLSRHIFIKIL